MLLFVVPDWTLIAADDDYTLEADSMLRSSYYVGEAKPFCRKCTTGVRRERSSLFMKMFASVASVGSVRPIDNEIFVALLLGILSCPSATRWHR